MSPRHSVREIRVVAIALPTRIFLRKIRSGTPEKRLTPRSPLSQVREGMTRPGTPRYYFPLFGYARDGVPNSFHGKGLGCQKGVRGESTALGSRNTGGRYRSPHPHFPSGNPVGDPVSRIAKERESSRGVARSCDDSPLSDLLRGPQAREAGWGCIRGDRGVSRFSKTGLSTA